jgi:hypothetical protein
MSSSQNIAPVLDANHETSNPYRNDSIDDLCGSQSSGEEYNGATVDNSLPADEGGGSDGANHVALLPVKRSSFNNRRSSPAWSFFLPIDPRHQSYSKNILVCMLCREKGVNKTVSIGIRGNASPTALINHIRSKHFEVYNEVLVKKVVNGTGIQAAITQHMKPKEDVKSLFKQLFCRWIVDRNMPFNAGTFDSFKSMVKVLNNNISVPDRAEVLRYLDIKKLEGVESIRKFIGNNYFSVTTDHWTSLANDNYGAITGHFIEDFKLRTVVLSFQKHVGRCSAEELLQQLFNALNLWQFDRSQMAALVTDSASNMNRLGELLMADTSTHHHYCTDHLLHLTASKGYSADSTITAVQALKSFISFVNNSPQTSDRLASFQVQVSPGSRTLKLLTDCKTRWWSTYDMVERAITLRKAIQMLFRDEQIDRVNNGRIGPSKLESLAISDAQFTTLEYVKQVLEPFAHAQRALEGDQYVNISLIVLIVKQLHTSLFGMLGAVDREVEPQLYNLINVMIHDFEDRWGDPIVYSPTLVRGAFNRQHGIPRYAYWAALLDPRTKVKTLRGMTAREKVLVWSDIQAAIIQIVESRVEVPNNYANANNNINQARNVNGQVAAAFLMTQDDDDDESDAAEAMTLVAEVSLELSMFQKDKGCPLTKEDGTYSCPLIWWKANHPKFPKIWLLARKILAIPATSAPAERVFSVGANVIDKKRAVLKPENVEILLFLCGNSEFISWD